MENGFRRRAYFRLYDGERVSRQEAEASHRVARPEIERLLDLGKLEEEVVTQRPRVSTIWFNKPADEIGKGTIGFRATR